MDAKTIFINLLLSAVITLVVILTPYIITRLITHRKIKLETAKKITIIFSVFSFIVFCIIDFLLEGGVTSVLPIIIWDIIGYSIIKPKDNSELENSDQIIEETTTDNNSKVIQQNITKHSTECIENVQTKGSHIVKVKAKKAELAKEKPKKKKLKTPLKTATIILSITTAMFIISTIGLSVGLVLETKKNNQYKSKIDDFETQIESKQAKITQLTNLNDEYISKLGHLYFYESHAVCVNENSNYYHKYGCKDFDDSSFLIYNEEAAKAEGYKPCPNCIKNNDIDWKSLEERAKIKDGY